MTVPDDKASTAAIELAGNRWEWFRHVLAIPGLEAHAKVIAYALATHVNDDEAHRWRGFAWPSHATLATMCGVTDRHARRGLDVLATAGLIKIRRSGGGIYID